jgi:hypothetical protein
MNNWRTLHCTHIFLQCLTNIKYLNSSRPVTSKTTSAKPQISSAYGVNHERIMQDKIWHEVITVICPNSYWIQFHLLSCNLVLYYRHIPFLRQFFLTEIELMSLWISERNVSPPARIDRYLAICTKHRNINLSMKRIRHRLRVFENRVLRRIFGPKRDELTGECRKLHNKELHDLYSSPSIIRIIKSRRMRWADHVARGEDERL